MSFFKKVKEIGGFIKEETKKDWQAMKQQYPKAKQTVRRARRGAAKFAKGAKKAHSEGRKAFKGFQESLPKVPDNYFERFNDPFNETSGKKKRRQY